MLKPFLIYNQKDRGYFMNERELFLNKNYIGEQSSLSTFDDPSYKCFKLFFYFAEGQGLLGDVNEVNTAANYLRRNGETKRLEYLQMFIDLLSKISSETPYIFKNLTGLNTGILTDLFDVSSQEQQLFIRCDATIDNRILALIKLYRYACFDVYNQKKEIVPINLRRFSMGVYLTEFSHHNTTGQSEITRKFFGNDKELFLKNHEFVDLGNCEILLESGVEYYEDFSNESPDYEKQIDLIIEFKTSSESSIFRGLFDETTITGSPVLDDLAQQTINDTLSNGENNQRIYSVKKINSVPLQSTETPLLDNNIQNADQFPIETPQQRKSAFGLGGKMTQYEQALIREARAKIGGALSDRLAPLILGNQTGLSVAQLRESINQIRDGNLSSLFANIRNFAQGSLINVPESLKNDVRKIENPLLNNFSNESLKNFVKNIQRFGG